MTAWEEIPTGILPTTLGPLLIHPNGIADEYPPEADKDPDKARTDRARGSDYRPAPFTIVDRASIRTWSGSGGSEPSIGAVDAVTIHRVAYRVSVTAEFGPAGEIRLNNTFYMLSRIDWTKYDDSHGSHKARTVAEAALLAAVTAWRDTEDGRALLAAGRLAALKRRAYRLEEAGARITAQHDAVSALLDGTYAEIAAAR